jgi:methyl-accepting chemotaxis protein
VNKEEEKKEEVLGVPPKRGRAIRCNSSSAPLCFASCGISASIPHAASHSSVADRPRFAIAGRLRVLVTRASVVDNCDNDVGKSAKSIDISSKDVNNFLENVDNTGNDVGKSAKCVDKSSENVGGFIKDVNTIPEDVNTSIKDVDNTGKDVDNFAKGVNNSPEDVDNSVKDVDRLAGI